jgi:hypothetical protein
MAEVIKFEEYLQTSHPCQYACTGTSAEGGSSPQANDKPADFKHLSQQYSDYQPLPSSTGYGSAKAKSGILHGGDGDRSVPPSENLKKTSLEAEASGSTQVRLGRASPPVPASPWMQQPAEPEQSGFWSNRRIEEINQKMKDEVDMIRAQFNNIDKIIKAEESIDLLVQDDDGGLLGELEETVKRVQVAMDSGACRHVINPDDLPSGSTPAGNPTGKVFHGANNSPIRRYGKVVTAMRNTSTTQGPVAVPWEAADVSRPLNSVSQTTGPKEGPGLQDVLFNNKTCYVVPPGTVERIMKEIMAIAEYPRLGDLYVADMELSSFQRQVAGQ